MSVYVMNCAGNPQLLLDAMTRRGKEAKLTDVEIIQTMITVPISYTQPEYKGKAMNDEKPNNIYL